MTKPARPYGCGRASGNRISSAKTFSAATIGTSAAGLERSEGTVGVAAANGVGGATGAVAIGRAATGACGSVSNTV